MTSLTELDSPHVEGTRTLEVDAGEGPVCLFLDGQFYRQHIGIPSALEELGLRAATLTSGTGEDRHRDLTCAPHYVRFIVDDVLPRIDGPVSLLVGVSLSGLAVAHLAFERPHVFPKIIAQSPSAWWNREALVQRIREAGGAPARAWISVGTREVETDVRHPPTAMHQETSQWDSVERLVQAWGSTATLEPFEGGHEVAGWKGEIGRAITWAMG